MTKAGTMEEYFNSLPEDRKEAMEKLRDTIRANLPRALYELGGPDPLRYRELVTQVARHLGRDPRFIKVPLPLWHALALALSPLPSPPLTRDTLWLISEDNLVANGVGSFADLGLNPRSLRDSLPHCLPSQSS